MANFSFDNDGTVSILPEAFCQLSDALRSAGHKCYMVTARHRSEYLRDENMVKIAHRFDDVICTARKAKRAFCLEHGIKIDVWFEDTPEIIDKSIKEIYGFETPEGRVIVPDHETVKNPPHLAT